MNTLTRIAAILIASLVATTAQAKHIRVSSAEIITCTRLGCDHQPHFQNYNYNYDYQAKPHVRYAKHTKRVTREALRVDKPQEYVKPDHPGDKLVTREAHETGSGIVRSHKTGATAHVSPKWAPKFQHVVDALEAAGASIYYMGGYRSGHCSVGSQHPCGSALDICQDSRGHVSGLRDCHMPAPAAFHAIVAAAGVYGGEVWCHTDYGHIQGLASGAGCAPSGWVGNGHRGYQHYATMTGKMVASNDEAPKPHHYRHRHYASR